MGCCYRTCRSCGEKSTSAQYDAERRTVICVECRLSPRVEREKPVEVAPMPLTFTLSPAARAAMESIQ